MSSAATLATPAGTGGQITPLKPFYMWAGGKSRLLARYAPIWPELSDYDTYVEPFVGGGAVFGWVVSQMPTLQRFVLGDVNEELIGVLKTVRDAPEPFLAWLKEATKEYLGISGKEARKAWYYDQRRAYWADPQPARLYLLMRLGFNGIWQTCRESNGLFGTPAGLLRHTAADAVFDAELIRRWSAALQGATLYAGEYTKVPLPASPALIYLDPPYRDSFTTYSTGFDDDDQKLLTTWFRDRVDEGHKVLLANRCVEGDTFFEDLIGDVASFTYFDVTYTAGRRKRTEDGFEAKPAREFLAISD